MGKNNVCRVNLDMQAHGIEISPMLYGLFFEDINFSGDGGIYGELIKNRSFEYFDINGAVDKRFMGWKTIGKEDSEVKIIVKDEKPINAVNKNYLNIEIKHAGVGIKNLGFNDIGFSVKKGEKYCVSMYARTLDKNKNIIVSIQNPDTAEIYGEACIEVNGHEWMKYETTIISNTTFSNAVFVLISKEEGFIDVDMISLFPEETFNNRKNGLRADMVQILKEIKPSFLRFPGGCIVEGRSFENMYRWKETIGEVSERKINWNRWQLKEYQRPNQDSEEYFQSYGLGFYEYFLLSEDIGAEPVPILNVGMTCQFHEGLLVPMDELDEYIQDVLDLIEYANGDETTTWGRKRIESGHPEPFNLKYLGIGNEQWESQYFERYELFHRIIKDKHPDIKLITSTGPGPDDDRFFTAQKWMETTEQKADIVDEHFYKSPEWFVNNINRYDNYDRNLPKVFAGEYAAHTPGKIEERKNNWQAAIAEAAFLTGIEKNSDHVWMACYAPLFAKTGHYQWAPNLIWFNNSELYGTPSYYVQQIFSTNVGNRIIQTDISEGNLSAEIVKEGTSCESELYITSSFVKESNEIIIKAVNLSSNPKKAIITINGVGKVFEKGNSIILKSEDLENENSYENPLKISPITKLIEGVDKEFAFEFDKYSVTVLRLKCRV